VIHVLLIDDESATRRVMQSRLREVGYEVTIAENGAQGLALAREHAFDLVLVDAGGGAGVTGFEVCRRLKQVPQTAGVPLLLLSKTSSRDLVPKGYLAGADACLVKSDLPVLEHVMSVFLRSKRAQDELRHQVRALDENQRRLAHQQRPAAPREPVNGKSLDAASVWRDLAPGKPDGVLVVDEEGVVRLSDRGANDLFGGSPLEGRNLGRLAPTSGLEAFVRDVRSEKRDGLRFDLPARNGRGSRSLLASVVPMIVHPGDAAPGLRVVLLLDAGKRRVATELIGLQEYTIPRAEVGVLHDAARAMYGTGNLIGPSVAMTNVRAQVTAAAAAGGPALIVGEPGSGRQHIARALHYNGDNAGPFLPIACAGLSPEHLEGELFGQVKGAFADALLDRPGALHKAAEGTVFLQDVDRMPLGLQAKLARSLRQQQVVRAGADKPEPMDARVVASTQLDLNAAVAAGAFDPDLLAILAQTVIVVAPLRERPDDLRPLTLHFLRMFGSGQAEREIDPEAMACILAYSWPGNVLELKSCIERACRRSGGDVIGAEHLPPALRDLPSELPLRDLVPAPKPARITVGGGAPVLANGFAYVAAASVPQHPRAAPPEGDEPISLHHYERRCLERALEQTRGDKLKAARLLKVGKSTLYRKLKRYGIK
jgi:DNA-binding NtrC family response regulator